jgi:hypothetical protein
MVGNNVLTKYALIHFCVGEIGLNILNMAIYERFLLNWGCDMKGGFGIL